MILFVILAFILILVAALAVGAISVGGAVFIAVFGDLIVCTLLIVFIIRCLRSRKNK